MGTDIYGVCQKRDSAGEWVDVNTDFFKFRSYSVFGWLAGLCNYSAVTPLSKPRGFPDDYRPSYEDLSYCYSPSWYSLDELLAVDYDQIVEDRRVTREVAPGRWNGGVTCDPGEGEKMTLKEFLGEWFIDELNKLKELGVERIIFWFD